LILLETSGLALKNCNPKLINNKQGDGLKTKWARDGGKKEILLENL
jgi:hypothetical protein